MCTEKKRICDSEAKEGNKPSEDAPSRRDAGRPEGRNRASGRDTKKLVTHHYVEVAYEIFICKYCGHAIYQPHTYQSAVVYAHEIEKVGKKEAYKKRLAKRTKVRNLLNRLNAGDLDALEGYEPIKIDETDEMVKILRRKGLAHTILGEL